MLRYYRCDTPYHATLFKGGWHSPKMVRDPPPWHLVSHRHICAIPDFATYRGPGKQARNSFAILSLQVSPDMKSIAAGPLSLKIPLLDRKLFVGVVYGWRSPILSQLRDVNSALPKRINLENFEANPPPLHTKNCKVGPPPPRF